MKETICALATPPIKSALAIIRVSGDDAFDIVSKVFSKDLTSSKKKDIVFGYIKDKDIYVDQVVLLTYVTPHSFTGEDVIEIITHGSPLITEEIIKLLIAHGARLATHGEFSSRAFIHKKIDLIQAEAINDVINATTSETKNLSLLSLEGKTSKLILPLKEKIADLLALVEVNIDYPEYTDIEVANKEKLIKGAKEIRSIIASLISEGRQGKMIVNGVKVAILGKPNVGKSSILNAILKEDKAIVTNIPGTTRDVVEGNVIIKGLPIYLYDTAGIHKSSNKIESIGISKSKKIIEEADVSILVIDASKQKTAEDNELLDLVKDKNHIIIYNKADKITNRDKSKIYCSAINGDISSLEDALIQSLGIKEESFSRPSLNNTRQLGLLSAADNALNQLIEDATNDLTMDLLSVSLQEAYANVLEILGESNDHDLTEEIFSRFCVGK